MNEVGGFFKNDCTNTTPSLPILSNEVGVLKIPDAHILTVSITFY